MKDYMDQCLTLRKDFLAWSYTTLRKNKNKTKQQQQKSEIFNTQLTP